MALALPVSMDREAGIAAYQAMVTRTRQHKRAGPRARPGHVHINTTVPGDAPVIRVEVTKAEKMTADVTKYEFAAFDGGRPAGMDRGRASGHRGRARVPAAIFDVRRPGGPVAIPDRGVARRRRAGRIESCMHRIFAEGARSLCRNRSTISNWDEDATKTFLMGGGIGITPMIAFAHRLHALGRRLSPCVIP